MTTYLTYSVHPIANFSPWFFVEMAGDVSSNAHRTRHPFPITAMGGSWDTRCVWSLYIFIKDIWTVFVLSTQQSWGFVTKDRNRIIPAVWVHVYRPLFLGLLLFYVPALLMVETSLELFDPFWSFLQFFGPAIRFKRKNLQHESSHGNRERSNLRF